MKTLEQQIIEKHYSIENYFFNLLLEKKINFTKLLELYIIYLEKEHKENRNLIVEAGYLLAMWEKPKLNAGTHKQLLDRTKKVIKEANIF